jgi:hypothetical protein
MNLYLVTPYKNFMLENNLPSYYGVIIAIKHRRHLDLLVLGYLSNNQYDQMRLDLYHEQHLVQLVLEFGSRLYHIHHNQNKIPRHLHDLDCFELHIEPK